MKFFFGLGWSDSLTTDNSNQNNALNRHEFSVYVLQNAANCIRASLDFQNFPGEDTPGTSTRKLLLVLVNKDIYSSRT